MSSQPQNPETASDPATSQSSAVPQYEQEKLVSLGEAGETESTRLLENWKPNQNPFHVAEPQDFGFGLEEDMSGSLPASPFAGSDVAEKTISQKNEAMSSSPTSQPGFSSALIKQLELRAIFSVDHEMDEAEILERSRKLPGVRTLEKVSQADVPAIDGFRQMLSNLGFGEQVITVSADAVPIEFIRDGNILLAVQTDGGFAAGVRETLILVARELGK